MDENVSLIENNRYRVLIYHQRPMDDLYLISCGIERGLPGNLVRSNGREGYHCHIIFSGKGKVSVNNEVKELHSGQIFVTKPGEDTWYVPDDVDPWSYCWMSFGGNKAEDYCKEAGFEAGVNHLDCHVELQRFTELVQRMLDYSELNVANELMRLGILMEFISFVIRSGVYLKQNYRNVREYSSDVYVEYALDYIHGNYSDITVNEIANHIGIHRSYLTNIFKKKTGQSPQEYLLQYRMNRAKKMLEETDMAVQEIARRVGYDNPLTFSKMYKKVFGVSPRNYRKQEINLLH